jgi:nucleoside-diphosphate-sugar epimerase
MAKPPGSGPEHPRPILLLGAGGGLGAALHNRLSAAGHAVHTLVWTQAQDAGVGKFLRRLTPQGGLDVLFAGGLTDPGLPSAQLAQANVNLPRTIITAAQAFSGCRFITFGTILERFDGMAASNPYVASKRSLADWIEGHAKGTGRGRMAHIQLHTLYGAAQPVPHMFLGQMISALRQGQPFAMSAGRQLREYHHVDDVAGSVMRLLSRPSWEDDPVLHLSSGHPLQLAALARAVFEAEGRGADLRLAQLPTPAGENLTQRFAPSPDWLLQPSREPLGGIRAWIRSLLRQDGGLSNPA